MAKKNVKIGTRGSPLALAQARIVVAYLERYNIDCTILPITTSGDRIQDRKLSDVGGKALFTKEIEEALLNQTVDIAVHSMKDVETILPSGLTIACILEREDARDVLITRDGTPLKELKANALVGTSSVRRAAQALALRPDLQIVPFRGNVDTRLRKLQEGQADATFLALAGLKRLHKENIATELLDPSVFIPAAGQGAIGLECRENDPFILDVCKKLNHAPSFNCVRIERTLLAGLQGNCDTPVGVYASEHNGQYTIHSIVTRSDGKHYQREAFSGSFPEALEQAHHVGLKHRQWLEENQPQVVKCIP